MKKLKEAQAIELFHVAFLEVLSKRLEPSRYVLKGGANLRYFFGSLRYSEDIDLDLAGDPPWNLEPKIDGVLKGPALSALLRVGGLRIGEFSKPKQTKTTRRWKIGLQRAGREGPIRTKVEFSKRGAGGRYRLEAIPASVVAPYALRSPSVQHYVEGAPTEQKVTALAGRSSTQARDVFDLDLLLRHGDLKSGAVEEELLEQAASAALALPYSAYRDQVLPFLEPEVVELYEGAESWEQMQTEVAEALEEAR